ncbi:MAG: tetratricopeptide repeat protein, partial [Trueperaceae bacterium]|nr:tetratricopeptide repeat protein [Trueperaceae bacterium]
MEVPMRPILTVLALALGSLATAASVAVAPFQDAGSQVGVVVADRTAELLDGDADLVVGPAAADALVPPFAFQDGFLTPAALLEEGGRATSHGGALLRAALGVDVAATGSVRREDDGLVLELHVARAGARDTLRIHAPADAPALLATRAARALARAAGLPVDGDRLAPAAPIAMDGPDAALAEGVRLVGAGLAGELAGLIDRQGDADVAPRLAALADAHDAVRAGTAWPRDPAVAATIAVTALQDDARTLAYLEAAADAGLPAAHVWRAAIAEEGGDLAVADDAWSAAAGYPYGTAAAVAQRLAEDDADADDLAALPLRDDPAVALLVGVSGDAVRDDALQRRAFAALGAQLPTFAFPFERLSFLAFDRDDAPAAAAALEVAVDLDPESSLYWTNLGWARYLLGRYDASETASERAVAIDPGAFIANYNLGLVRARFGRLADAMPAYEAALTRDPEVDDEALADVENALEDVPEQGALWYVLGRLYEAEGRRGEAADAYARALDLGALGAPFDARAEDRVAALSAPPPPVEISDERIDVRLGGRTVDGPLRPGDPVTLAFELYTPGDALPARADVHATFEGEDGAVLAERDVVVEVPENAIGYVVEEAALDLPTDLAAGRYVVAVEVRAYEDLTVAARRAVEVAGEASPLRRLIGRGVTLTSLRGERPLYDADDADAEAAVVDRLVGALRGAVTAAEETLPVVETGPFEGLSGGALFEASDADDVRTFLAWLADADTEDVRLSFVDAYAQWALDGA